MGSRGGSKKQLSLSAMRSTRELGAGAAQLGEGEKGMVLPFDPLHLTFHNLSYYVDLPKVCHVCCPVLWSTGVLHNTVSWSQLLCLLP